MLLRAFDRLLAAVLLGMFAPVMCLTAIVTLCLSGRTPLVAHRRIGRNGRPFWMLKFRTMWGAGVACNPSWLVERLTIGSPESKGPADTRVCSSFARICRRFSIDELPQLAHVIAGQMSLVGPRPITQAELSQYYGASAEEITRILPGMTGLWQVMGRNRLSYRRRRRLDLFLVRHFSTGFYFRILLRTVPRVLLGNNAW